MVTSKEVHHSESHHQRDPNTATEPANHSIVDKQFDGVRWRTGQRKHACQAFIVKSLNGNGLCDVREGMLLHAHKLRNILPLEHMSRTHTHATPYSRPITVTRPLTTTHLSSITTTTAHQPKKTSSWNSTRLPTHQHTTPRLPTRQCHQTTVLPHTHTTHMPHAKGNSSTENGNCTLEDTIKNVSQGTPKGHKGHVRSRHECGVYGRFGPSNSREQ